VWWSRATEENMTKTTRILLHGLVPALLLGACSTVPTTEADREEQSTEVKDTIELFKSRDPGLSKWFTEAHGYAVFPTVGKGGMGVGGAFGRGQVFENGTFIGYSKLSQATIGLQLGGQEYAEVIFLKDKYALSSFTSGTFEFAAQASAVAVRAGASADADYNNGVAVFTMPRGGAMFEASVGGQKFGYEKK